MPRSTTSAPARTGLVSRCPAMAMVLLVAVFQFGCASTFVGRDINFEGGKARAENNEFMIVAMTDSEWTGLSHRYGRLSAKQRQDELLKNAENSWKNRSKLVKVKGKTTHTLLAANDPLWNGFRSGQVGKEKMKWLVLLVIDTNWISPNKTDPTEGWYAGYQANPEEFGEEVTTINFGWNPGEDKDGKGSGPELLNTRSSR